MLEVLVERRRSCRICPERNPEEICNGADFDFDPHVVSYWSQWLGHVKPKVLIVGQDFGDVSYFRRFRGKDEPYNTTNDHLRKLLAIAGIEVGEAPKRDPLAPVFLTNAVLCLKTGKINAPIREPWTRACARNHLLPLLTYLEPNLIVGMGKHGWLSVRTALDIDGAPQAIGRAAGQSWIVSSGARAFAVGHCSGLGLLNRSWDQQAADWREIGRSLMECA